MSAQVSVPLPVSAAPLVAEDDCMLNTPIQAALPGPAQFAAAIDLIKSVFCVPAVSIALHGAPANADGGVYRSFLEIPLIKDQEVIGSLRILDTAEREFTDRDCQLLEGFARLVVDQVELWGEASRDVLTGAMTRRAFQDILRKAFAAYSRTQARASLVLFDLDHFKSINDNWGHAAGDAVLKAVARCVLRELRVEDSFGRVGGEEFAVLVANAGAQGAAEVAERIRSAVEALPIPGYGQINVTASFGVAEASHDVLDMEDWSDRADSQLYVAKSEGRNRVCIEDSDPPPAAAMLN
ncbi:sensor domain-containing diguanylate cyclase [Rhodobacter sp. NTK016B]|uniref:sensor domain-containing diguanylate cyclase n=1 Tax=Rhodobacter sp. NTK016B TaxID=2759676 RepID=UPI001A8DD6FC|nr:sensor domain-containing diguanylate cyclase [Rhodobacter sp. NTK016B]MBN8294285.1 sensor domain-containing diguanylate cyclase [Rhodobacter sp. NTK016B]